jgi:voltage-gated potassium channel
MLSSSQRRIQVDDEVLHVLRCLLALATVVVFGTAGFMLIESDWGLWKSLFFTLITITTVGYGDQGLSPNGEVFAAVLLLFGIGTATYSVTALVQSAVRYHGQEKKRMQDKIDRLTDHFIICGFGRIGLTVCEQLSQAGLPFVVIDCNTEAVENAIARGCLALVGNSTDEEVLTAAGMAHARGVVCAINSDAENVFVTLCAREMNKQAFIASRASTAAAARRIERAGASIVVSPYTTAGQNIADAILRPRSAEFLRNHRASDFELSELTVAEGSFFDGRSVIEIGQRFPTVVFVAMDRENNTTVVRPGGKQSFLAGDRITVAGERTVLEEAFREAEGAATLVGV